MATDDVAYYRQRAISERVNARTADRAEIAEIHEELARLYDALIEHEQLRPTLRVPASNRQPAPTFLPPASASLPTLGRGES